MSVEQYANMCHEMYSLFCYHRTLQCGSSAAHIESTDRLGGMMGVYLVMKELREALGEVGHLFGEVHCKKEGS